VSYSENNEFMGGIIANKKRDPEGPLNKMAERPRIRKELLNNLYPKKGSCLLPVQIYIQPNQFATRNS
jgi:hypothetical protein